MPDKMRYCHCCSTVGAALFKAARDSPASSTDATGAQDPALDWGQMLRQPVLSSPHWHCHPNECEPTHLWACASQVLGVFNFASPHQELQLSSNITRCNFCPAWPRHVLSFNMFWAGNEGTFAYYQLLKFLFSFPPNKYFSRPNTKSYTVHSLWNVHFIFKELASRRAAYLQVFWSSKRKEKR